nr:MAG TPA: hypothetical protein [Caudoviricetes sp.]DAR68163.1 MAG TPA: hypothetical protein [Caudoviricetes sp.]
MKCRWRRQSRFVPVEHRPPASSFPISPSA